MMEKLNLANDDPEDSSTVLVSPVDSNSSAHLPSVGTARVGRGVRTPSVERNSSDAIQASIPPTMERRRSLSLVNSTLNYKSMMTKDDNGNGVSHGIVATRLSTQAPPTPLRPCRISAVRRRKAYLPDRVLRLSLHQALTIRPSPLLLATIGRDVDSPRFHRATSL